MDGPWVTMEPDPPVVTARRARIGWRGEILAGLEPVDVCWTPFRWLTLRVARDIAKRI